MVENLARESVKIIPETGYFLSEMISDLIESPPTSPPDKMSNSKLRDCLKAAQSDNKDAKRAELRHELLAKTKEKSTKSHDREQARKKCRRKPGREKLVESSQHKSTKVETKEQSSKISDKSKKKERDRKRYEETVIDNIVISAFKSWEDLQDEVNERISASKPVNNQWIQTTHNDFDQQCSTAQTSTQSQDTHTENQRVLEVAIEHKVKDESSSTIEQNSGINLQHAIQTKLLSSSSRHFHELKKRGHREKDEDSLPKLRSSFERLPSARDTANLNSPKVTEWVPDRHSSGTGIPSERVSSDIARSSGPPHLNQRFSGQNSHRILTSLEASGRDLEEQFNRNRHQQLFGPPVPPPYGPGHLLGNAFHHNPPVPNGSQMSSANQYLQQYMNSNSYGQHIHDNNPYGLPASNHPVFSPHTPFPAPNTLSGPYMSPYTITDTIISRQTIIPPTMGANRLSHLPGPLSAIEHGPASMMKYPTSYVPSPTERSFMEFARSYANANNISSFMNQPTNSSLNPPSNAFNPSFERFLADQRMMSGPNALVGLHSGDRATRFGILSYHNEARSAINPPTSFYPHLFR